MPPIKILSSFLRNTNEKQLITKEFCFQPHLIPIQNKLTISSQTQVEINQFMDNKQYQQIISKR